MKQSIGQSALENLTQPEVITSRSCFVRKISGLFSCLATLIIVAACASVEVTDRNIVVNEKLPRPSMIFVSDFIANPADIPKNSSAVVVKAADKSPTMTPENIKIGGISVKLRSKRTSNTL